MEVGLLFVTELFANQNKLWTILSIAVFACLAAGLTSPSAAFAFNAENARAVDNGFEVFSQETFNGNGRTCETCHLPQHDFGLSASDLASMSAHQKDLVFATNVPHLENPAAVRTLTVFNEAKGGPGDINNPGGPFRTSIPVGGLAFNTLNTCRNSEVISSISGNGTTATVTTAEPVELMVGGTITISGNSLDAFNGTTTVTSLISPDTNSGALETTQFTFASSTSGTGSDGQLIATMPCPGAAIIRAPVDDGIRNIQLGWGGNGSLFDTSRFPDEPASANCIAAINAFAADPTNLTLALGAFDVNAVRTHFTQSLNRVPGVDFTCPTPDQLNSLAVFLEFLGRQFEMSLCSDANPSSICTGTSFAATQFASGRNGTQTPFSPSVITFNDNIAETGKAIFLDSRASCNLCHLNAGAQSTFGGIRGERGLLAPEQVVSPFNTTTPWQPDQTYIPAIGSPNASVWSVVTPSNPNNPNFFLAFTSSAGMIGDSGSTEPDWPTQLGAEVVDNEITWINMGVVSQRGMNAPARNMNAATDTDLLKTVGDPLATFSGPNGLVPINQTLAPFFDPQDTGDGIMSTGMADQNNGPQGGFNIQSIIEAPRKGTFFHAGAITSNIEDAASFYFTSIFDSSGSGGAIDTEPSPGGRGCNAGVITGNQGTDPTGCGTAALKSLADTYTDGDTQEVLNHLGFFLRSLSTVYSIADCERLVTDTIGRVNAGLPTTVPVLSCTGDLGDINRVLGGAHERLPGRYFAILVQAQSLVPTLNRAAKQGNVGELQGILHQLEAMRHGIASISPDLQLDDGGGHRR